MRIITNIPDFPKEWVSSSSVRGTTRTYSTAWEFFLQSKDCDAILINCEPRLIYELTFLFLLFPLRRKPLIAMDLVLRRPTTLAGKMTRPFKRALFRRVDHFIHYFRELDGYERYFGIAPTRSSYVPFKSGILKTYSFTPNAEGEYVLCLGWSERDYNTFIKAMSSLPYPGAMPRPNFSLLKQNGSRFTIAVTKLPGNIRLLDNDGSIGRAIQLISNARVVALPIKSGRISSSGISTYLMAMAMGKCVVITEGPGASDVLTNEALLVPAEDSGALASVIRKAWEDTKLRERTAAAGQKYAENCGTTAELYDRVLAVIVASLRKVG